MCFSVTFALSGVAMSLQEWIGALVFAGEALTFVVSLYYFY